MTGTILLVDDSKVSRMMVKRVIAEIIPEATIIEAAEGEEALAKLAENHIDAAILDFHMPGMDGMMLAEKMKGTNPSLRSTMLTANIQKEIASRAEALGIGYIAKPADKEKLGPFLKP